MTRRCLGERVARLRARGGNVRSSGRDARRGFTLMELLVSSALLSTLMAGLWGLVNIFTSLSDKGDEATAQLQEVEQLLLLLQADLKSVCVLQETPARPALRGAPLELTLWRQTPPSLAWLGAAEPTAVWIPAPLDRQPLDGAPLGGGGAAPSGNVPLPTADAAADAALPTDDLRAASPSAAPRARGPWPLVRKVNYFFLPTEPEAVAEAPSSGDSPATASRDASPSSADALAAAPDLAAGAWIREQRHSRAGEAGQFGARAAFPGIAAVRFGYFDGRIWQPSWHSALRGRLPRAVRIELWVRGGNPFRTAAPRDAADAALPDSSSEPVQEDDPLAAASEQPPEELFPEDSSQDAWLIPARPADLTRVIALQP
jgi:prepilin-type N-terminal cleavage/methylation domain-containing protein